MKTYIHYILLLVWFHLWFLHSFMLTIIKHWFENCDTGNESKIYKFVCKFCTSFPVSQFVKQIFFNVGILGNWQVLYQWSVETTNEITQAKIYKEYRFSVIVIYFFFHICGFLDQDQMCAKSVREDDIDGYMFQKSHLHITEVFSEGISIIVLHIFTINCDIISKIEFF